MDEFGYRLGFALLIAINLLGVGLIGLTVLTLLRVW